MVSVDVALVEKQNLKLVKVKSWSNIKPTRYDDRDLFTFSVLINHKEKSNGKISVVRANSGKIPKGITFSPVGSVESRNLHTLMEQLINIPSWQSAGAA